MWSDAVQDFLYSLRSLRKAPGFAAVAILTLALGVGANTAIFSVINSVLLRPLPYRDAGRLVFVWNSNASLARSPLSPARFLDFRDRLGSLSMSAGICQFGVILTGGGSPEQIDGSSVSSNFFDVLGASPLLGNPFHAGVADERAVVLSYGLWVRRFGSDPRIVGRDITIDGTARRVHAVMRQDFGWPGVTGGSTGGNMPELWIPGAVRDIPRTPAGDASENLSTNRTLGILRMVGRLRDGVTLEQARHEATVVAAQLAAEHPETDRGRDAVIVRLREQFFGPVTRPLAILLGAVAFVLVIACVNVAGLLLGRGSARRREIALRLALGATRRRIVRQLLTESLVLSVAGSAAGLLLAAWGLRALIALSPGGVLRLSDTRIDLPVLVFTVLLAIATGLLFGALPAWQVSGASPNEDLKDGGARGSEGVRGSRTRSMLVGAEIAIALMLLVGAGLLLRSFNALSAVDTGLDLRNLLTFTIAPPGGRAASGSQQRAFYDSLLREIESLPGVNRAGAAVTLPIGGDDFSTLYTVEGAPVPAPGQERSAGWQIVSHGYFDSIGMRIVGGRGFREGDAADAAPVVIVNQTLARQCWPGTDPVGRRLRLGRDPAEPLMTVVGMVSDMRHRGPAAPPRPEIYQPLTQRSFGSMDFVVRTSVDPLTIVPLIRSRIARLAPSLPMAHVGTMEQHVERSLSRPRFMSALTAAFGGLAVTLALVGIYGVMAASVSQRTREIAIRIALGARPLAVVRLITAEAASLAAAGVVAGLLGAWASSRVLAGLLFGVTPWDPITYIASATALFAVALAAAAIPARGAARIDGARVLRS
jgi:putative ABC transport system permease protein